MECKHLNFASMFFRRKERLFEKVKVPDSVVFKTATKWLLQVRFYLELSFSQWTKLVRKRKPVAVDRF